MFRITSETELRDSFRLLDRDEVHLPADLAFPLFVPDYYSWTEPSGCRTYLVVSPENGRPPLGIVFRQGPAAPAPAMCEWCHATRGGTGVALLTAAASDRRRVGLSLCRDLSCREKMEQASELDTSTLMPSSRERVQRVMRKMGEFARRHLF